MQRPRFTAFAIAVTLVMALPAVSYATAIEECELRPVRSDCTVVTPSVEGWPWPAAQPMRLWIACRTSGSAPGGPSWRRPWRSPEGYGDWQVYLLPHEKWTRAWLKEESRWHVSLADGTDAEPLQVSGDETVRCLGLPTYPMPSTTVGKHDFLLVHPAERAILRINVLATMPLDARPIPLAEHLAPREAANRDENPVQKVEPQKGCAGCTATDGSAGEAIVFVLLCLLAVAGSSARVRAA